MKPQVICFLKSYCEVVCHATSVICYQLLNEFPMRALTMKHFSTLSLFPVFLLLVSCAGNPPQQNQSATPADKPEKSPPPAKTIVPDINATGHRGDLARAILSRASAKFLEADENRDYRISLQEAGTHLPHINREFSYYDKDGDGGISWQEYVRHDQWPAPEHGQ